MTILEQLEKVIDDMYIFCKKMYVVIDKSNKDKQIVDIVTQSDSMDERFIAEQIVKARSSMDQTFRLIEYMHSPVLLDGNLKKRSDGLYVLCGKIITHRIGIEYVKDDCWRIGIIQKDEKSGDYIIVDENIKKVDVDLDNLHVRTREKI